MVVFDSAALLLAINPNARPPSDPATGQPLSRAAARIEHLVDNLSKAGERIIVPTPVLSEILVGVGDAGPKIIDYLTRSSAFHIASFDVRAAAEAARAHQDAIGRGGKRIDAANPKETWAKIKFDRQIVAIAVVQGARTVYSDDKDVITYARRSGLEAIRTADLDLPPEDAQGSLDLDESDPPAD